MFILHQKEWITQIAQRNYKSIYLLSKGFKTLEKHIAASALVIDLISLYADRTKATRLLFVCLRTQCLSRGSTSRDAIYNATFFHFSPKSPSAKPRLSIPSLKIEEAYQENDCLPTPCASTWSSSNPFEESAAFYTPLESSKLRYEGGWKAAPRLETAAKPLGAMPSSWVLCQGVTSLRQFPHQAFTTSTNPGCDLF